jgi:hypothetical protein
MWQEVIFLVSTWDMLVERLLNACCATLPRLIAQLLHMHVRSVDWSHECVEAGHTPASALHLET